MFTSIFALLDDCVKWVMLLHIAMILLKIVNMYFMCVLMHLTGGVEGQGRPEKAGCLLPVDPRT